MKRRSNLYEKEAKFICKGGQIHMKKEANLYKKVGKFIWKGGQIYMETFGKEAKFI